MSRDVALRQLRDAIVGQEFPVTLKVCGVCDCPLACHVDGRCYSQDCLCGWGEPDQDTLFGEVA